MNSKQILDYLDICDFPMLGNGYYYHIDQKMSIFKSGLDWAILLQVLAYNNHELDVLGIKTIAYTYGNLIDSNDVFDNDSFFSFVENFNCKTFIAEEDLFTSYLNPKAKYLKVRDYLIPIEHDLSQYKIKGISLKHESKITPWELMRFICPKYSNCFWLTRNEISTKIPIGMEEVATINNWGHPDCIEESPSDMESFKIVANYIESWNQEEIEKIKEGNTHWKNWPIGGNL